MFNCPNIGTESKRVKYVSTKYVLEISPFHSDFRWMKDTTRKEVNQYLKDFADVPLPHTEFWVLHDKISSEHHEVCKIEKHFRVYKIYSKAICNEEGCVNELLAEDKPIPIFIEESVDNNNSDRV